MTSCYGQPWTRIPAQKPREHTQVDAHLARQAAVGGTKKMWTRLFWSWGGGGGGGGEGGGGGAEVQSITYRTTNHLGFLPLSLSLSLSLSLWLIKKGDVIPSEPVRAPERGRGTSAVTEVDWQAGSLIKGATSVTEMRAMWMEMYGC